MNAAQALLREVIRDLPVEVLTTYLSLDLLEALKEELERADTTPTHTEPIHRTDPDTAWKAGPVVGEQTMRRFGLVRDELPAAPLEVRHTDIGDGWTETSISTGHIDPDALRRAALNAQIDAADEDD